LSFVIRIKQFFSQGQVGGKVLVGSFLRLISKLSYRSVMSIFEAYDSEFSSLSQDIIKNVGELKNNTGSGDKTGSLIKQIEALFSQSADLIKQMEVEVRSHDPATRKMLNEKVNQYKKSNGTLKSDFERAKEQSQKASLVGGNGKSGEQRQRLLDTNDKLVCLYDLQWREIIFFK
jgi:hypothetical protein